MKEYPFLRNFGSLIQSLLDTCDDIDTFAATELKKTEDVRQEFRYDGEETLKKMIEKVETYISNVSIFATTLSSTIFPSS